MKQITLLIVDDEPRLLNLLRSELESSGYRVICASNGLQALEMFTDEEPDLVILDVKLDKIDGFEVCRRLRMVSRVPIIVLSAHSDFIDRTRAIECGADNYITKPFSRALLEARIIAALRRSRSSG